MIMIVCIMGAWSCVLVGASTQESLLASRDERSGYGATAPVLGGCPAEDRRDALLGYDRSTEYSRRFTIIQQVQERGCCRKRDLETYKQDSQIATLAGIGIGPIGGFVFYAIDQHVWPAVGVGVATTALLTGMLHCCARCVKYCEEQSEE
ncbi:hypothetical protein EBR77_03965 [bacterium]|nr:hypothetical protein [bacterium]NBX78631.1 hypothetical protein [bacterium]